MIKQRIIYGIVLLIIIACAFSSVNAVSEQEFKNVLRSNVLLPVFEGKTTALSLEESRELLNLYLTIPKGQVEVNFEGLEEVFQKVITGEGDNESSNVSNAVEGDVGSDGGDNETNQTCNSGWKCKTDSEKRFTC